MNVTLVRWMCLVSSPAPQRKSLMLPATFAFAKSRETRALEFKHSWKKRVAELLSCDLLDRVMEALWTDVNAWAIHADLEHGCRWVAEHFLIWLYDLGESNTMQVQELNERFQEARVLRNRCVELCNMEDRFKRPTNFFDCREKNGTVSFWTALQAFNAFRFVMLDRWEAFEIAAAVPEPEVIYAANTATCEVLLVCATRARENAAFGVLAATRKLLEAHGSPSALSVARRDLKTTTEVQQNTNMLDVCALTRVILSVLLFFRVKVGNSDPFAQETAAEIIKEQSLWCLGRTPSFVAVRSTPDEEFCKAVARFEAACILEGHALVEVTYSNDVIKHFLNKDVTCHHLRKTFLKVTLALKSETFDIWTHVPELNKERVLGLFASNLFCIDFSGDLFVAFHSVFQLWNKDSDIDSKKETMLTLCKTIVDVNAHKMWAFFLKDSQQLQRLQWPVVMDTSLKTFVKTVQLEDRARCQVRDQNGVDVFADMQFTLPQMQTLVKVAAERKWDWI